MAERMLAGHTMVDGPGGMACKWCGKSWLWLLDRRDQWVPGASGIAHTGSLYATEVKELNDYLEHIYQAVIS